MSVLGRGDLAPSRKRRRGPGGAVIAAIAVLLLAAIAYGGYYLLTSPNSAKTPEPTCTPAAGRQPARAISPASVHLRVLNGTGRTGLAKTTGDLLRSRRFLVDAVGNSGAPVTGTPVIRYGPDGRPAAELLALQLPSGVLTPDPRLHGRVDLILASAFSRLRTPAEVAAATRARAVQSAASPRPTPGCR